MVVAEEPAAANTQSTQESPTATRWSICCDCRVTTKTTDDQFRSARAGRIPRGGAIVLSLLDMFAAGGGGVLGIGAAAGAAGTPVVPIGVPC